LLALTAELNLTEQRERKRVAIELRDSLAQLLVLAKLKLAQGLLVARSPERTVFEEVQGLLSHALDCTRTGVADLSPPVLHDLGLPLGLRWLGERMKPYGLTVTVQLEEPETVTLSDDHAMLLFQSVRELLLNVAQHAQAGEAWVRLAIQDGQLHIDVRD